MRGMGLWLGALALLSVVGTGCTFKKPELGEKGNPIKLFFIPSVEAGVLATNGEHVKKYLEQATGYKFEVAIPQSYVAVVEAFGAKRADVAAINTFGYILAHEKYGATAKLTVLRYNQATYSGQIVVRADSKIKDLKDLNGKKFAFVDPASTSGYLLPMKLFADNGIKPKETVFGMKHDNVISMVYQKQVDGGATFYSPPEKNEIQDARRLVKTQYPDVEEKIKILKTTGEIPNDPIIFRADLPEEMKTKITDAFMAYVKTEDGKAAFKALYGVTDLQKATDKDYDGVRDMLKSLNVSASALVK